MRINVTVISFRVSNLDYNTDGMAVTGRDTVALLITRAVPGTVTNRMIKCWKTLIISHNYKEERKTKRGTEYGRNYRAIQHYCCVFIHCHCYWTGGVVSSLGVARSKSSDSIPERLKNFVLLNIQLPFQLTPRGSFPGEYSYRVLKLKTHFHIGINLRTYGAMPPLPHTASCSAHYVLLLFLLLNP